MKIQILHIEGKNVCTFFVNLLFNRIVGSLHKGWSDCSDILHMRRQSLETFNFFSPQECKCLCFVKITT